MMAFPLVYIETNIIVFLKINIVKGNLPLLPIYYKEHVIQRKRFSLLFRQLYQFYYHNQITTSYKATLCSVHLNLL